MEKMNEVIEISKKTKIKLIVITVLVFLFSIIGMTYAYFGLIIEGNDTASHVIGDTADMRLEYTDVQLLMKSSAFPGWSATKTFTVENTGNETVSYIIKWRELQNEILNGDLVLSATCSSSSGTCDNLPERPIPATITELTDVYAYGPIEIDPEEIHTYTLTVQYKERGINQKYNSGASFSGILNIGDGTPTDESLFTYTVSNNEAAITGYNPGSATFEIVDTEACMEYFGEEGWDISEPEVVCAGGENEDGDSIELYLALQTITPDEYEEVGIDNVQLYLNPRDIIIPSTLEGYPVRKIGARSLGKYKFTSIVFPSTLRVIENQALIGFLGKTIVIPEGVTTIGNSAFSNSQLTSMYFPDTVTSIGEYAIYNCRSLITTKISESPQMTTISHGLGQNSKLKAIIIPDNITTMDTYAFLTNEIEYIYLSSNITTIPQSTFQTNNLTSLEIPDTVTRIETRAFQDNPLTSIEIPNSVTFIGTYAFYNNYLSEVTIPSSVTSIGSYAFYGNTSSYRNLESVKIQTKTTSSQFTGGYGSNIWGWKSTVTCVMNNASNVANGCITWGVQ